MTAVSYTRAKGVTDEQFLDQVYRIRCALLHAMGNISHDERSIDNEEFSRLRSRYDALTVLVHWLDPALNNDY